MFQPRRFGKYTLVDRIAVGGMAEVFKARAQGLKRPVVVKQILPQHARDQQFVEMFIEEAKLSVTLNHGNIVGVYELGRIEDCYFLVMEYVRGRDLADILQAGAEQSFPLAPELAALIAQHACAGLDYAHRKTDSRGKPLHIVHRDLSPPNLLVSYDGQVKITDFGIAKAADRLTRTEAGVVRGTQGYMSPEQASGLGVDARTDVFSVGVLLWEMLTLHRLFVEKSELIRLRSGERPPLQPPSEISERVPRELDSLVLRALAPLPEARFQNAQEMGQALTDWLATRKTAATPQALSAYMRTLFREAIAHAEATPPPRPATGDEITPRIEIFASQPLEKPGGRGLLWASLAVLLVFLGALWLRGPAKTPSPAPAQAAAPNVRYGDLMLTSAPPGAAVYVRLGLSPVEAPNLDIGQTHEVLVLKDGAEPFRAHIAPDAWRRMPEWRTTIELDVTAVSLEPLTDPGAPRHVPGTARVETKPAGQEVWLLVGFTPHMQMDDLRLDRDYEFLFEKTGYEQQRLRVLRNQWNPTGLDMTYDASVVLKKRM